MTGGRALPPVSCAWRTPVSQASGPGRSNGEVRSPGGAAWRRGRGQMHVFLDQVYGKLLVSEILERMATRLRSDRREEEPAWRRRSESLIQQGSRSPDARELPDVSWKLCRLGLRTLVFLCNLRSPDYWAAAGSGGHGGGGGGSGSDRCHATPRHASAMPCAVMPDAMLPPASAAASRPRYRTSGPAKRGTGATSAT